MEADSLFAEPTNVLEKQLKDIFSSKSSAKQEPLFQILSLVIHHNPNTSDINDVYRLLGMENFVRLIHLLDGRTVRFPTSSELKDALVTSICYYYREVAHEDWSVIKEKIPFEIQPISMARKIKNLNMAFSSELQALFKSTGEPNGTGK